MYADASQLLRRLEPAVRPTTDAPARVPPRPAFDEQDFAGLLSLVSSGRVSSGREVAAPANLEPALTAEQLERLAAAADRLEAAGARRALALIDGRGLVLDVATRRIEQDLKPGVEAAEAAKPVYVDAAVYVAGPDDAAAPSRPVPPGRGVIPAPVAAHLLAADSSATPSTPANPSPHPHGPGEAHSGLTAT